MRGTVPPSERKRSASPTASGTSGFGVSSGAAVVPLGVGDVCGLGLMAAVLLSLSFLQSRHRMFWGDEIMGDTVLRAGSFGRFLQLWRSGFDSSGLWFYLLAKPWEWIFGPSEVSLRMFSAAGIVTAAGLLWLTARRFYSVAAVGAALAVIFLDLEVLRWQLANGRCYGVFMAATALVLFLIVRGEEERYRRPGIGFLLGTALSYDVLTGSHTLGVAYAGGLLATQIGLDLWARRPRPWLYLAAVAGIVPILAFSLGNIRGTAATGKPMFWTSHPRLLDIVPVTNFTEGPVRTILALLFVSSLFLLHGSRARRVVYAFFVGALGIDGVFLLISRFSTSIYTDRYLLPLALILVLLGAELLTQIRDAAAPHPRLRAAAPFVAVLLAVAWMPPVGRPDKLPVPDYTSALLRSLPPDLPVIDTDPASFREIEYYHHGRMGRPFFFPVDAAVLADPAVGGGVSGLHEMERFQSYGVDAPDLQSTEAILAAHSDFLVVTAQHPSPWLQLRLLATGAYDVHELGTLPDPNRMRLWEAHRR